MTPRRPLADRLVTVYAGLYLLAALALHLLWFPIGDLGVEADFYAELAVGAQRLAAGDLAAANYTFKGPVYSFALAAVHAPASLLGADWYRCAVLLNALCAAASLLVLHRLLRRHFPSHLALAAVLTLSTYYEFFLHAHKASSDLLFLLLCLAATDLLAGAASRRRLAAAGLAAGLAVLTRYNGVFLAVVGAGHLLWRVAPGGRRVRAADAAVFLAGVAVVCAPWFAAFHAETGRLAGGENLMNVKQEFYGRPGSPPPPPEGFDSLVDLAAHDPGHFISHYLRNLADHLRRDLEQVFGTRTWPAAAAGLLLSAGAWLVSLTGRRRFPFGPRSPQALVIQLGAASFLLMALVFHLPRLSLPLVPAYAVLGWSWLFGLAPPAGPADGRPDLPHLTALRPRRATLAAAWLAVAALCATGVADIVGGVRYYRARRPLEVLAAADDVRAAAAATGARTLMARKPHLAHYAGLDFIAYPREIDDWQGFFDFAHERGADLILVGPQERGEFPTVRFLDRLQRARGVTVAYQDDVQRVFRLDRALSLEQAAEIPELATRRAELSRSAAAGDTLAVLGRGYGLARDLLVLRAWDEAAKELERCLTLGAAVSSAPSELRRVRLDLAYCRLMQGSHREGLALLAVEPDLYARIEDPVRRAEAHGLTARLLAGLGRDREALRHFRAAHDLFAEAGREGARREMLRRATELSTSR